MGFMMGLRLPELLIILVVLLLVFGANKIPQLGDALGKGIRNFKKATEKEDDSIDVTPKQADPGQLPAGGAQQGAAAQTAAQAAQSKKA
jgi:sec-independent protein translocase protein TatA